MPAAVRHRHVSVHRMHWGPVVHTVTCGAAWGWDDVSRSQLVTVAIVRSALSIQKEVLHK
ncbi:hypothetical protein GCM10009776_25650 [Microbacterium deminutum]|uniref:Uncharacterized protein n=1 Tax=Microbacterium deminutum TaxID=344164 RepID=A0ABP5CCS0_9MICO